MNQFKVNPQSQKQDCNEKRLDKQDSTSPTTPTSKLRPTLLPLRAFLSPCHHDLQYNQNSDLMQVYSHIIAAGMHQPPWPNGQGVGLLIRRLRVRVPQGVHLDLRLPSVHVILSSRMLQLNRSLRLEHESDNHGPPVAGSTGTPSST